PGACLGGGRGLFSFPRSAWERPAGTLRVPCRHRPPERARPRPDAERPGRWFPRRAWEPATTAPRKDAHLFVLPGGEFTERMPFPGSAPPAEKGSPLRGAWPVTSFPAPAYSTPYRVLGTGYSVRRTDKETVS